MTPDQRIDANIDAILRASGSGIDYYTMPRTLESMREAMRRIMADSYIKGSNDNYDALVASGVIKR
jgi:hypothetical protein